MTKPQLAAKLKQLLPRVPCACKPIDIDFGHKPMCWKAYLENGLQMLVTEITGKPRET